MTQSRDEQRPSQAYTDGDEGSEQEGEYLADENFQPTENNSSGPTWDAQQAHDNNEQGSRYKVRVARDVGYVFITVDYPVRTSAPGGATNSLSKHSFTP
jgi:hypothetical protein